MTEKEQDACSSRSGLECKENELSGARRSLMVNHKESSDVTFIVGPEKQRIYAHKEPLMKASTYFRYSLFGSLIVAEFESLELVEEEPEMFLAFLRVIYGTPVDIDTTNCRAICARLRLYDVPISYYKPLIDYLTNQISKETAMKVLRENEYFKFATVDEMCLRYIRNDPLYYFKTDDFTGMSENVMMKIIDLKRINCTGDQLLEALQKWSRANNEPTGEDLESAIVGTVRRSSCDMVCLISTYVYITKMNSTGYFKIQTKNKPITLYGIGVYLNPPFGKVSLRLRTANGNYKVISVASYRRISQPLELVDLMFEALPLAEKERYEFCLSVTKTRGTIVYCEYATIDCEPFQLVYNDPFLPAIAQVWFKYSDDVQKELTKPCRSKNQTVED